MEFPSVAVIIPTYNRWPHVCRAIDSVLGQSYANVECIVVDDASTDGSTAYLRGKYGDRINLISKQVNEEKSAARNDGIRASKATYVCMCDSDDELTPDSVASRMSIYRADPTFDGVAYGVSDRGRKVDLSRYRQKEFEGDILDLYLQGPFIDNNCFLLSRANMLSHGMYTPALTNREDMELLIRLMSRLPFRFCGSIVAAIKRVDSSAQGCFDKIIHQGRELSRTILANHDVVERLGEARCRQLKCSELQMLARAHYKSKRFAGFRQLARELKSDYADILERPARLSRRQLASYLLQLLEKKG